MPFDEELARVFIVEEDRDRARWFAGRADEIETINLAVRQSRTPIDGELPQQALFRVLQGAPGAGKTTLVRHMRLRAPNDRLYVNLDPVDLATPAALDARIDDALDQRDPEWARRARRTLEAVGHLAGRTKAVQHLSESERVERRRYQQARLDIVLCVDEAQTFAETPESHAMLRRLHTTGFGKPCVLLLTGLSDTADVIGSIRGVSRPARTAQINLSELPDKACHEVVRNMLAELDATRTSEQIAFAERELTDMSFGWPQHLNGAQVALVEQLVGTGGDLGGVDYSKVRARSDTFRFDYYRKRLASSPLLEDVKFTARIVTALRAQNESISRDSIDRACLAELQCEDVPIAVLVEQEDRGSQIATAKALGDNLIAKGVLAETDDGHFDVAIPSMADWLDNRLGPGRRMSGRARRQPPFEPKPRRRGGHAD